MSGKQEAINALKTLREYTPKGEYNAIVDGMRSEEKQFFFDKVVEMENIISTMPKTYDQDGKGNKAVAYLHYFKGNMNWYITEKDVGTKEEQGQHQAFGLADLGYGGEGEMGYISIVELVENEVELDLYFVPKTIEEIVR